jgi:hypothetical protein
MTSNVPSPINARHAGSAEFGADFVLRRPTDVDAPTC